mmetsp:Transcript_7550/g.19356  ORF Transcript_7550/g.19356 Transcript_7550/m.19356 type:complete len:202 (+) Transcript_7550:1119-1724(+)
MVNVLQLADLLPSQKVPHVDDRVRCAKEAVERLEEAEVLAPVARVDPPGARLLEVAQWGAAHPHLVAHHLACHLDHLDHPVRGAHHHFAAARVERRPDQLPVRAAHVVARGEEGDDVARPEVVHARDAHEAPQPGRVVQCPRRLHPAIGRRLDAVGALQLPPPEGPELDLPPLAIAMLLYLARRRADPEPVHVNSRRLQPL